MINVGLAAAPGVLGDLLAGVIERDPEFHLTARTEDQRSLAALAAKRDIDAVIVCEPRGSGAGAAPPLLDACHTVAVIEDDGKDVVLHARRRRDNLGGLSPGQLLAEISRAVRNGDA